MVKRKRRHVPVNPRQGSLLKGPRKDTEKEIVGPNAFPRRRDTKKGKWEHLPFYGKYNRWAKRNTRRLHKAAQKIRAKTADVQEIVKRIAIAKKASDESHVQKGKTGDG